jgi:hypothetical protein
MDAYEGVEVKFLEFLTSALGGRLSDNFHAPGSLPLVITGGWMGPRVCLNVLVKRKICVAPRNGSPVIPSITSLFTDLYSFPPAA